MTDALFDPENVQPQQDDQPKEGSSFYEQLVGEGKKYKDQEALAKAYFEGDSFIERLKAEQAEIRKDLEQRLTLEQLMDRIEKKKSSDGNEAPNQERVNEESNQNENRKEISQDDIEELVNKKLQQVEANRSRTQNVNAAKEQLKETFGNSWEYELSKVAKDMGVTADWLTDVAARSPSALMKLVGQPPKVDPNSGNPPKSSYNSSAPKQENNTEWTKLQELRRTNPTEYWKPTTQQRIFELVKAGKMQLPNS